MKEFSDFVKLKDIEEFTWEDRHQEAFDKIKDYLSKPHVLMPLIQGHPLKLYLSPVNVKLRKNAIFLKNDKTVNFRCSTG